MSAADPPEIAAPAFELDGLDLRDGRVEVRGRWFGVRGRRFVRPALEIDGVRPLLAVLEHRPWAAIDGEAWVAAFPWEGSDPAELEGAELVVAPGVAVVLGGGPGRPRRFHRGSAAEGRATQPRPVADEADLRRERDAALRERDEVVRQRTELLRAREDQHEAALRTLREERDAAVRAREEAERALRRQRRAAPAAPRDSPPPVDWVFRGIALLALVLGLLLVLSLALAIF